MKKICVTDSCAQVISPVFMKDGVVYIQYNDAEKGAGGVKITFEAEQNGFKKVNVHYDHHHKTGMPVKAMVFINMADSETEGGLSCEWHNNANGNRGRYQTATMSVPVIKGTNTLRIASVQNAAGWDFSVDYIEISTETYSAPEDIPAQNVRLPLPEDFWGIFEAESMLGDEQLYLTDLDEGRKGVYMSAGKTYCYGEADFGEGEAKSIEFRYEGEKDWPYVEMRLDSENGEVFAEGSLPSASDNKITSSKINFTKNVTGRHKIYLCFIKGDAVVDKFSFTREVVKYAEATGNDIIRDLCSDTWVATDDLGRITPMGGEVPAPRKDKYVGMFYFLWHQGTNGQLFDHNKTYLEGGAEKLWEVMAHGPKGYGHYWSEPYFGYYRTEDEWIIRRHARMLVEAGVDFIFLDTSNSSIYSASTTKILNIYKQMRAEGSMTPQVVFFMGIHPVLAPGKLENMYYDFFKDGRYDELWFKWQGKPLVLGNTEHLTEMGVADRFTTRTSWAFNKWTEDGKGKWPWIALDPQAPGRDPDGNLEQVTVSCGFHANGTTGRSYTSETGQPTDGRGEFEFHLESTPKGVAFDKQWETAYELDPPVVMLTGWNEWWAGRWENSNQWIANTYRSIEPDNGTEKCFKHFYVDCFNPEFSRDIEPMKGGFKDNYYYQTVQKIRKFKGARPVPKAFGAREIDINGSFEQWKDVGPGYLDSLYDTVHRNCPANQSDAVYVNTTGRNDFDTAKVSSDGKYVYFYIKTREPITTPEGTNWMNLFVDSDRKASTGWYGYDFVINRNQKDNLVSVEKCVGNSWEWETAGYGEYRVEGCEMHIKIEAALIGAGNTDGFDFKWADNSTDCGDIMEFHDKGDVAPDGRFNFRYIKE